MRHDSPFTLASAYLAARRPSTAGAYTRPAALAIEHARRNLERLEAAETGKAEASAAWAEARKIDARRYVPAMVEARAAVDVAALEWSRAWTLCQPTREPGQTVGNLGKAWSIGSDSVQWCERPEDIGLRRVGFADEIIGSGALGSGIKHQGWYLDSDGSGEVARAEVYLFPARGGQVRAVAAIADHANAGAAILALADIVESDPAESSWDTAEAVLEAARNADSMAETYAEAERNYRTAWAAGNRHADAGAEASELRAEFLDARREGREAAEVEGRPILCGVLWKHLHALAAQVEALRQERADLADGGDNAAEWLHWWPQDARQAEAFADGANL